jgi:hypothetical protein
MNIVVCYFIEIIIKTIKHLLGGEPNNQMEANVAISKTCAPYKLKLAVRSRMALGSYSKKEWSYGNYIK